MNLPIAPELLAQIAYAKKLLASIAVTKMTIPVMYSNWIKSIA
jgi:hypothetical protein